MIVYLANRSHFELCATCTLFEKEDNMEIKDKYIDSDGKVYNIRNVNFDINSPIQFFGEKVAETSKDYTAFLGEEDYVFDGVYICKTSYDPKKALRIYAVGE